MTTIGGAGETPKDTVRTGYFVPVDPEQQRVSKETEAKIREFFNNFGKSNDEKIANEQFKTGVREELSKEDSPWRKLIEDFNMANSSDGKVDEFRQAISEGDVVKAAHILLDK